MSYIQLIVHTTRMITRYCVILRDCSCGQNKPDCAGGKMLSSNCDSEDPDG